MRHRLKWINSAIRSPGLLEPRRAWVPYLVLVVGLVATVGVASFVAMTARDKDWLQFREEAEQTRQALQSRLDHYGAMLRGGVGLFAASSGEVTRRQFRAYVDQLNLPVRYPGIRGVGYSQRMASSEIPAVEASMRTQGIGDFHVWPINPARLEYHSILYLEPTDARNRAAIGYDMFSEPIRAAAMAAARDTGRSAVTDKVTLVQEIDRDVQAGFLIYVAVYAPGAPLDTVEQRRAALAGFIYSPFRAGDLFGGPFVPGGRAPLGMAVYNSPDMSDAHLMYRSISLGSRQVQRPLGVVNETWTVVFSDSSDHSTAIEWQLVPSIMITGVLLSLALYYLTHFQAVARTQAEHAVADLRRSEQSLRQREQELRLITDSLPALISYVDRTGHYRFVNERYAEWQHLPADRICGRHLREVLEADILGQIIPRAQAAWDGQMQVFEATMRCGGEVRVLRMSYVPDRSETGEVAGFVMLGEDITEPKRDEQVKQLLVEATEAMASSLDYQQTLGEVARRVVGRLGDLCAVHIAREDGTVVALAMAHAEAAKQGQTLTNAAILPVRLDDAHGVGQVLRTGLPMLRSHADDSGADASIAGAANYDLVLGSELRSIMIVPLMARGRTLGAISMVWAQSDRRHDAGDLIVAMELARRAAIAVDNAMLFQEAQRANRMKDEFLATVSHELRTPLNAVLGWAQLMRMGGLDAQTIHEAVEAIERNARTQAQLIEDLLDLSRIIRGTLRMRTERVRLGQVVEDAVAAVHPAALARTIRLTVETDAVEVPGDPTRLQQVIWNLLSNAVKFTPEGGTITVKALREGDKAVLRVIDNGQGIAPEFLPHVFDRFSQADGSSTRRQGGLGLGLAIVRHLVELHGGTVQARSEGLGHGTEFIVTLPTARPVDESPPLAGVPALAASPAAAAAAAPLPLAGTHILVVDDEADARRLLATVLVRAGAEVSAADSAQGALDAIAARCPDLLVSDIGMPGEDGYSLIRRIRALPPERGGVVAAIALTAFARSEDRCAALEAGFQVYLAKPVPPAELIAALVRLEAQR